MKILLPKIVAAKIYARAMSAIWRHICSFIITPHHAIYAPLLLLIFFFTMPRASFEDMPLLRFAFAMRDIFQRAPRTVFRLVTAPYMARYYAIIVVIFRAAPSARPMKDYGRGEDLMILI